MTEVLVLNAASTFFMVGLTWFVQVVHYPLFPFVGGTEFPDYHERHSNRTTWVVLPPMLVELVSSFVLLTDPPAGEAGLAIAGALLAGATWLLTAAAAAPTHGRIGREGLSRELGIRLIRISWVRTLVWTGHGAVVCLLLLSALSSAD